MVASSLVPSLNPSGGGQRSRLRAEGLTAELDPRKSLVSASPLVRLVVDFS